MGFGPIIARSSLEVGGGKCRTMSHVRRVQDRMRSVIGLEGRMGWRKV